MDEKDKKVLLQIARKSVESAITGISNDQTQVEITSPELKEKNGAFVTLRTRGRLRGCIGRMVSDIPLHKLVSEMAVSAATDDTRFNQIEPSELDDLEIDISVLSPLQLRELDAGGNMRTTRLNRAIVAALLGLSPQVATDT